MEFPTGTTAVLVNGKHVLVDEYLASLGEGTAVPVASSSAPPDVRAQTDMPPVAGIDDLSAGGVAANSGVSHLVDSLYDAGFHTAESIHNAAVEDLTAVSGIGKATAAKLKAAAKELLS